MESRALPGFREFYPDDTALRNQIFAAWREVAARYGFEEYDGPPLEPLELYTEKSGAEIVEQLYAFEDKGGRRVALRPEMTPTLARMVAARARALKKPIRWFSIPQLFRYERQQRGRLREHFQLNMDLIGEPGPLADAEIIAAAIDIMRSLGLGPDAVCVRVSDRRVVHGLLVHRGLSDDNIQTAYSFMDKLRRGDPKDLLARELAGRPRLTKHHLQAAFDVGSIESTDALQAALREAGLTDLGEPVLECARALEAMGLGQFVEVDLSIVRGLAYYTGIVFELFDRERRLRAICGGGRYDGLLGALGGADLPAVGFGMGDVVLGELLRERVKLPAPGAALDAFLVAVTAEDVATVLELAHALRDDGIRVEFTLRDQPVGRQLKLAAGRPARCAVIVGPDERAAGQAVVRDLASGEEERVAFADLGSRLRHGRARASEPAISSDD